MLADVDHGGYLSYWRNSRRRKYCTSLVSIFPLRYNAVRSQGFLAHCIWLPEMRLCRPEPAHDQQRKKSMGDRIRRSWLIVPAHDEVRMEEAAHAGADVIVLDLQDTVHDTKKHVARARVRET